MIHARQRAILIMHYERDICSDNAIGSGGTSIYSDYF